jgi:hypothetical protein
MSIIHPEPCVPCGAGGSSKDVENLILCDVLDGEVVGAALAVYEYDSDGNAVGPPTFVDPVTGAPYVPIGTLQPCPTEEFPSSIEISNDVGDPVPISGTVEISNDTGNAIPVIDGNIPDLTGTWAYAAGSSGSRSVVGRVLGIAAHATAIGATCEIDGGDAIPVPTGAGISLTPVGNLLSPTIVFTGTDSYMVEFVS